MALIHCKECQKEISSDAVTCPHCGVKIIHEAKARTVVITIVIMMLCFFSILMTYVIRIASVDGHAVGDKVMIHMENSEKWAGEIKSIQFFSVTCSQSDGLGGRAYFSVPRSEISWIEAFNDQY